MGIRHTLCVVVALGCFALCACKSKNDTRRAIRLPPVDLPAGDAVPLGLIIITVDTLRADYLSAYGHAHILTPSIDRLAAGGQLFRNAYSQATTTTPSHASLFTSLYLQDHNVYSNFEALGDQPRTLAEIMHGRGFATFSIVNMKHLNPEVANLGQGVQTYIKSGNFRRADATLDKFFSWLTAQGERPFYAWLHMADVHTPYRPPAPYSDFYYDGDKSDPQQSSLRRIWSMLPVHMSDHPFFQQWLSGITDLRWVYAQYQGAVSYVDDQIGRLLDELERRDLLHRTAIVFTSDHGESLGEHDMYFVHTGLYEPTIHVPLITYFPGAGRQGVDVDEIVELVDVMPTVLDYFDIAIPKKIRGRSLWGLMDGELRPEHYAFIEHAGRNLVALRSQRFKYIKHLRNLHIQPSYPFILNKEELYDVQIDPLEKNDLAQKNPDAVRVFRRALARRRSQKLAMATGKAVITEETIEVLRALGYVK